MKKDQNYSIRLTEKMVNFLVDTAKQKELLPSEYLRELIRQEMERTHYNGKINK